MSTSKRSQKSKSRPEFNCTIFLDRTHGKAMGKLLRRVGFPVRSIFEVYPKRKHESISDPTWIARCSAEGWIAITGDKKIEIDPINKNAVIAAKCKVFVLSDSNSMPEEWAAAIIVARDKIISTIKNDGPFFSTISKQSHSHVSKPRNPLEPRKQKRETVLAQSV